MEFSTLLHNKKLKRIARHVGYWLFWLLLYASVNAFNSNIDFFSWIWVELQVMCIKLPFTYFAMYYLVPQILFKGEYVKFFFLTALSAAVGGLGIWGFHYYILAEMAGYQRPASFINVGYFFKSLDLIYIATFPVIYKMQQHYVAQEKRNQQISQQKLQAELELLKHQLHPHFLFNTLNNLYGLILAKDQKAGDSILYLSSLLSFMLYDCTTDFISLEKEIAQLKNYIELEKIRYGSRLQISFETAGNIEANRIAPLLLFVFIENAFKHGVGKNLRDSWIRVNLWVDENQLVFMIENNKEPGYLPDTATDQKGGIGLANIRKRLELIYPDSHTLTIADGDTYIINLTLSLL